MDTLKAPTGPPTKTVPVVITPAIGRVITELMATRRVFNRSQLMRLAITEMADKFLPPDWRERADIDADEAAS